MSSPDIHPENLLEKLADGDLSPSESKLLQEHLSGCAACRFELMVRDDLETEAEALQFDRVSVGQLLLALPQAGSLAAGGAVSPPQGGIGTPPPTGAAPGAGVLPAAPRRFRVSRLRITVAALALASGAAALVAVGMPSNEPTPAPTVIRVIQPQAAKPAKRMVREQTEPETSVGPKPAEAPVPAAARVLTRTAPAAPPSDSKPTREPVSTEPTPAELFSQANQARRASDAARATQLYRVLQRKYPSSQEAQLSLVTLGSLQLNGGNAAGALNTFNRYLSQAGRPLEAEALYGQAQAYRQLGRTSEEVRAWKRLLARHPSSGYATQARERLSSLGGS